MRYLYFFLAALGCIAALLLRAMTGQPWMPLVALLAGAAFLALGLWRSARPATPVSETDLSEEQRAELNRLLENGQFGTAVKQVQLWFKGTDYNHAEKIVRGLNQTSHP